MKVYLDSIGCRLNQAEIEKIAHQFRSAGHEIVGRAALADLAVVNTCAVTNDAAAASRQKIRQIARDGVAEVVPTGCWVSLQPQQAQALPNVSKVVVNDRKDQLVEDVLDVPQATFDLEPLARQMLPGLHRRTRAFLKVQDGCDNRCTFCVTTVARGAGRSRPMQDVLHDVCLALEGDTQEVVLTGVHLGSWGQDFDLNLSDLVQAILKETSVPRLRLSSLEPWDLTETFFKLWENPRLLPHLHLPLQSGCEATLRRMARKTTPNSFRDLVAAARRLIPDVAVTTDVIAGFPSETEEEFAETLAFVEELEFAGGHVFTYSPRPETGAVRMKGQVRSEVRRQRNHTLQAVIADSAQRYRQQFVGQHLNVLWESTAELGEAGWRMEGYSDNYLRVTAFAETPRWNTVDRVFVSGQSEHGLFAQIVS